MVTSQGHNQNGQGQWMCTVPGVCCQVLHCCCCPIIPYTCIMSFIDWLLCLFSFPNPTDSCLFPPPQIHLLFSCLVCLFSFFVTHSLCMVRGYYRGLRNLPVSTLPKRMSLPPAATSYRKPVDPQGGAGTWELLPSLCWDVSHLDLVQGVTGSVSSWVPWPSPGDSISLYSSTSSLSFFLCPLFFL